jgi:hypothetical protein
MSREGIGKEHPINDKTQVVFALTFLVVWGLESFIFHFSKGLWINRLALCHVGIISFIIGLPCSKGESVV